MSDLIFLLFLNWLGLRDLRSRKLKHWQIISFALYGLLSLFWQQSLSLFTVYTTLGVVLVGWIGYLNGRWGAADVKVITITTLCFNLYSYSKWWVPQALLLTVFIDVGLWGFYFRHRNEDSPLVLAWAVAVVALYVYYL